MTVTEGAVKGVEGRLVADSQMHVGLWVCIEAEARNSSLMAHFRGCALPSMDPWCPTVECGRA